MGKFMLKRRQSENIMLKQMVQLRVPVVLYEDSYHDDSDKVEV